ncbi:MAG: hypothetical protein F9K46_02635 [Anaerolineae bacterium]|nr:MAG: hypothetical protein F9K46_02635 [Anaerolineae bacterium]
MNKKFSLYMLAGVILLGFAIGGYGVYQYVDAELKLRDNEAEKLIDSGQEVEVNNFNEGYELFKATVERDKLRDQRANALPLMGVGMAVVAVGWLGYELIPILRKNRQSESTENRP